MIIYTNIIQNLKGIYSAKYAKCTSNKCIFKKN